MACVHFVSEFGLGKVRVELGVFRVARKDLGDVGECDGGREIEERDEREVGNECDWAFSITLFEQ